VLRSPGVGLTERALIERIAALTSVRAGVAVGVGDDAAVLDDDPATVATQDLLVEGVHFRRRRGDAAELRDLGHRALAVNLSDLAAMGAVPLVALVGLGTPGGAMGAGEVDALYGGMEALAARTGTTIAGGDVTAAPALVLAVTAIGRMPPGAAPVLRRGARPGDRLVVTGPLGAAAAGLLLLEDPLLATGVPEAEALRAAQLRPEPRLEAGRALARLGATAMLDCSDGLALDAARIAEASGLAVTVDLDRVPLAPGVARVAAAAGREADLLAGTGGEDYELLAAVPPDVALPSGLVAVGAFAPGDGLRVLRGGAEVAIGHPGWEHGAQ
jgi:thiamine-monophosphate kinase